MIAVKSSEYRKHLARYHKEAVEDHEAIQILGSSGDVVVMAKGDYEDLIETVYILKDKVTMASLLDTRKEISAGSFKGSSVEDAFDDIMDR